MEIEFDEMIARCERAILDMEEGNGSADTVCVWTRSLHFACTFVARLCPGMLSPARAIAVRELFNRAETATARARESVDASEAQPAGRVAKRAVEIRALLAPFADVPAEANAT